MPRSATSWSAARRPRGIRPAVGTPTRRAYGSRGGRIYGTALAALTLEVYYRYLRLYDEPTAAPIIAPAPERPADSTLRRTGARPPAWLEEKEGSRPAPWVRLRQSLRMPLADRLVEAHECRRGRGPDARPADASCGDAGGASGIAAGRRRRRNRPRCAGDPRLAAMVREPDALLARGGAPPLRALGLARGRWRPCSCWRSSPGPLRAFGQLFDLPGHARLLSAATGPAAAVGPPGRDPARGDGAVVDRQPVSLARERRPAGGPAALAEGQGLGELAVEQGTLAALTPLRDVFGLGRPAGPRRSRRPPWSSSSRPTAGARPTARAAAAGPWWTTPLLVAGSRLFVLYRRSSLLPTAAACRWAAA